MPNNREISAQYDRIAEAYAADADVHPINALYDRPAMLELTGDVDEYRVLEVGCAAGGLTRELIARGASVTATDASSEMIRLARESVGNRRATVRLLDVTNRLPFRDSSFDMVVSSLTLHYVEDWEPVLHEFRRILLPQGSVVFSTHHPAMDWEHTPDDYFAKRLVTEQWTKSGVSHDVHFWRRPLTEMTTAIAAAGFHIERIVEPAAPETLRDVAPRWHDELRTRPRFLYFRLISA
jgi:ubiquinone/menaquinone biosynthesis C-methylase UbiE